MFSFGEVRIGNFDSRIPKNTRRITKALLDAALISKYNFSENLRSFFVFPRLGLNGYKVYFPKCIKILRYFSFGDFNPERPDKNSSSCEEFFQIPFSFKEGVDFEESASKFKIVPKK